ncbi:MAG: hypothetical protein EG828_12255 [Deltaproteobacteria bacterium]|nr:hypothetical protein [Deltaproteobacteria bacterium]
MAGKKELVRGGLASVFGGLDKKQETEHDIQGTEAEKSPTGLLDSTSRPTLQAVDTSVAEIKKETETVAAPQVPARPAVQQETHPQHRDEKRDPYAHVRRAKWPILEPSEPYIIPGPEGFESLNATVNFRLPANLDATLDAHCRSVGARKSAWIREAILKFLAEEQLTLEKEG